MKPPRFAKRLVILIGLIGNPAWSMGDDDPLRGMWSFNQLEFTAGEGEPGGGWDADGWIGRDLDKLRLLTEGEFRDDGSAGFFRLVYSRTIAAFWDIAGGWRREFGGGEQWDAATIELLGILPYNIDTQVSVSLGEGGQTEFWSRLEYMINFGSRNPRWVLLPELEFSVYGKDEPERGIGSGLSDLELGLRLHRQIRPDFAPYAGVSWTTQFGATADVSKALGQDTSELRWLLGLQFWF